MFIFGQSGTTGGFDPLILLLAALVIDAVVGDLRFVTRLTGHPLVPFSGLAAWFERKLNRESRSQGDRAARGAFVVIILVGLAIGIGLGISWLTQTIPVAWAFELILLVILIPQRSLFRFVQTIGKNLRSGDSTAARQHLSLGLNGKVQDLDDHAVARTAIEISAERFATAIVAPVFWYVLFGFSGFLVFQVVNALQREIGREGEQHRAFGFTAARLNYVMLLIPGWIAGVLLVVAALFVPTTAPGRSLGLMLKPGAQSSTTVLWPLGAVAGALGLALTAGRAGMSGSAISWIGENGRAQITPQDIRRALYLLSVACLVNGVLLAAVTVLRFG